MNIPLGLNANTQENYVLQYLKDKKIKVEKQINQTNNNYQGEKVEYIYKEQIGKMEMESKKLIEKSLESKVSLLYDKNKEEYSIQGPISPSLYNLVSANYKVLHFRALKVNKNTLKVNRNFNEDNKEDDINKLILKAGIEMLEEANNEVKKSIAIGIKEAEAIRINKNRNNKNKIKKIKIYSNPNEESKSQRTMNQYIKNKIEDKLKFDKIHTKDSNMKIDNNAKLNYINTKA
ncbi:hypothetical protein KQI86_11595 [Clostridium sp. MSJ-11]|uniref:Uncharacterized protein n=1 Tax=Clostridium mobile TaxID=2841512 RepID=A0ABS6EIE3_9CLOT|nr:hypothetical protein [Clostridium mobile]MBU5484980.1 hypothetical protein [Clostridium mobile]